ncbi:MAG: carboxylesterase [Archangium sp.]|nr:carboxylesterase [Archangium sp.]
MCLAVFVGCSRKTSEPPPPPVSAAPSTSTMHGELAGIRYLERMTGGAQPDERVPMIIALHPMGGDPSALLEILRGYTGRARIILPFGHPRGGMYEWYYFVPGGPEGADVTREADRLAVFIEAVIDERPTVGKPIVTGFSQGGIMTFGLAVTHPESMSAAFPISGRLPASLYPSVALSSKPAPTKLPAIVAFHGADDLAVPTADARASIAELQRAGYAAELREYSGLAHETNEAEVREIYERLASTLKIFPSP